MNKISDFFKENLINKTRAKKVIKNFEKDKKGNIIIKDGTYVISKLKTDQYNFTNGWIFLSQPGVINREEVQGTMALIKSYIPDKCPGIYTGTDIEILKANNFIMSEIAKQFELEAAEYYNIVFENSEELDSDENYTKIGRLSNQKIKPNKRYLLTPSFRKNDEKFLHLAEILSNESELNAAKILKQIQEFLQKENVVESDIDTVLKNFIKQSIFNKYIDFSDEHNLNAGILISNEQKEKRARLAPCYDLDFSGSVFNITDGGIQPKTFFRHNGRYGNTLTSILDLFNTKFERKYLKEIISKIDVEEAIRIGEKNGNFKLSEKAKNRYMDFFREQQNELESFYEKYCKEEDIQEKKDKKAYNEER